MTQVTKDNRETNNSEANFVILVLVLDVIVVFLDSMKFQRYKYTCDKSFPSFIRNYRG